MDLKCWSNLVLCKWKSFLGWLTCVHDRLGRAVEEKAFVSLWLKMVWAILVWRSLVWWWLQLLYPNIHYPIAVCDLGTEAWFSPEHRSSQLRCICQPPRSSLWHIPEFCPVKCKQKSMWLSRKGQTHSVYYFPPIGLEEAHDGRSTTYHPGPQGALADGRRVQGCWSRTGGRYAVPDHLMGLPHQASCLMQGFIYLFLMGEGNEPLSCLGHS